MRVATAAISHETNTFTTNITSLAEFETATGKELLTSFESGRSLAGIVETLHAEGVEIVPTVGAATLPSGTVSPDALEWIRTALIDRLDPSLDGICLDLHGSMYVAGEPDPEGTLLEAVREVVGPDVPIVAALDMHATITERMVDHLDGVAGYRTAPHTDVVETGERAANVLLEAMQGNADLCLSWERIPMLLAGEQSETEAEPMSTLIDHLTDVDDRTGVYDANYFLGFPWADSPHAGCHALVTGDRAYCEDLQAVTKDLAARFWELRHQFDFSAEAHRPERILEIASRVPDRPVVISETGDIPGAGASEDLTDFLVAVLSRDDLGDPVFAIVADSDCVETCKRAGEGETVTLELGCRLDDKPPVFSGTVVRLLSREGTHVARIDLGSGEVIVADERSNLHRDPGFFTDLGIEPSDRDVIVLKSGYLSPEWKRTAARQLFALTGGDTNQSLSEVSYQRVPSPLYPLDEEMEWSA